jgi:hypothetical protein
MDKVSREDIESCIHFIREEVEVLRQQNPNLERVVVDGVAIPVPHPWERPLRVADALERILKGEDADKALGLTAPEGTPPDMATHDRRARALWPYMLEGHAVDNAFARYAGDKHTRPDKVSIRSYQSSVSMVRDRLMVETLNDHIDGKKKLPKKQRRALARMMMPKVRRPRRTK